MPPSSNAFDAPLVIDRTVAPVAAAGLVSVYAVAAVVLIWQSSGAAAALVLLPLLGLALARAMVLGPMPVLARSVRRVSWISAERVCVRRRNGMVEEMRLGAGTRRLPGVTILVLRGVHGREAVVLYDSAVLPRAGARRLRVRLRLLGTTEPS